MANQRGSQNTISVESVQGSTVVKISGQSIHSNRDAQACADILAEVLFNLDYKGEHKVVASMQRLKGSGSLQGLSITGLSINAIQFGYQPNGNDTRATYTLQLSCADEAQKCFVVMKAYIGTAYKKVAILKDKPQTLVEEAFEKEGPVAVDAEVSNPLEEQKTFFTDDPAKMEIFMISLLVAADSNPGKTVTKNQTLDLIVEQAGLQSRFRSGPILKSLKDRGYLLETSDGSERYTINTEPSKDFHRARSKQDGAPKTTPGSVALPQAKVVPKKPVERKQKYLSDEEWMQSFVQGLRALVQDSDGLISRPDLYRFIKERTNQKKVAGTVYTIVDGLKLRGVIHSAGEALFRFTYSPPEDIVERAVKSIERARAETGKVFEGFAKFRMPDFAEGMFRNTQLLRDFLSLASARDVTPATLKEKLAEWYPVSDWSHIQLLNYMVGQGYFVRSGTGKGTVYKLGPKGYERLGLPLPKTSLPVSAEKPAAQLTAGMVKRETASVESSSPDQLKGFLATKPEEIPAEVLAGLAKLATEGREVSTLITQAKERIAQKHARKEAALAAIAQKPNIDALVTARLLAEISRL